MPPGERQEIALKAKMGNKDRLLTHLKGLCGTETAPASHAFILINATLLKKTSIFIVLFCPLLVSSTGSRRSSLMMLEFGNVY